MEKTEKTEKKEKVEMNIYQKLVAIQNEMAAPKDQTNEFGKYQYRTLEAINERLKPLLDKYACTLYFNDEVYTVADTTYLKTTATLIDSESGQTVTVSSPCPIDLSHKGMSLEQCGGSSLSYSRKYCLGGLLLLDGNTDPDSLKPKTLAEQVASCTSIKQLLQLWQQLTPDEGTDETVKELFNRRKAQLCK